MNHRSMTTPYPKRPTDQAAWEKWFEGVWSQREDVVYRELFGDIGSQIHTVPPELFTRLSGAEIDPRWLHHGVFECPDSAARSNWVYVTSSLSNPWGEDPATIQPDKPSGLGFEMTMQTAEQSPWAIQVLHWLMAVQILAASGFLQGELISEGARIPLMTSIDPQQPESLIRNLVVTRPEEYADHFPLDSGIVELLLCVGVTDKEMEFARLRDAKALISRLKAGGGCPLTQPGRGDCA